MLTNPTMSNQYPWTRLKKGCLLLKDLSLRWKVLIPVVGAILVLAVVIFGVSQSIIRDQAEKMALSKVQSDLALMYELIDEKLRVHGEQRAPSFTKATSLSMGITNL